MLLLDRDPDDEENGSRRVLAHIKCNVGPEMPSLLYEIEPVLLAEQGDQPRVETSRFVLLGESAHDGRSLLELPTGEERSQLEEAINFFEAELGDGNRHPAGDLVRAARALGHSVGTIHAAGKRVGVEKAKTGFSGGWEWWLPKIQRGSEPSEPESSRQPNRHAGLQPVVGGEDSKSVRLNLRPLIGDDAYLEYMYAALEKGVITEDEWHQGDRAHRCVVARKSP